MLRARVSLAWRCAFPLRTSSLSLTVTAANVGCFCPTFPCFCRCFKSAKLRFRPTNTRTTTRGKATCRLNSSTGKSSLPLKSPIAPRSHHTTPQQLPARPFSSSPSVGTPSSHTITYCVTVLSIQY